MQFVSDFADQAVMLPMAIIVLAVFGVLGWARGSIAWLAAVGGTFAAILILKAGSMRMAASFGSEYLMSPSGHVAAGCVVYGGLAVLLLKGVVPAFVIAPLPISLALVIGYSRLALAAHTEAEVLVGAVVGLSGVALLALTAGPRPRIVAWPSAAVGAVTVLALHGFHIPAEEAIRQATLGW